MIVSFHLVASRDFPCSEDSLFCTTSVENLATNDIYRKDPQISRAFFPKIVAQNRGCGLSAGTFGKGAINLHELTLNG